MCVERCRPGWARFEVGPSSTQTRSTVPVQAWLKFNWEGDPFPVQSASRMARADASAGCLGWLKRLLAAPPLGVPSPSPSATFVVSNVEDDGRVKAVLFADWLSGACAEFVLTDWNGFESELLARARVGRALPARTDRAPTVGRALKLLLACGAGAGAVRSSSKLETRVHRQFEQPAFTLLYQSNKQTTQTHSR